jgi:hypothetical protein
MSITKSLMLFHGASIDNSEDILFSQLFKNFTASFLALEKYFSRVISAHNNDTKVWSVKVDVNIEQEFF